MKNINFLHWIIYLILIVATMTGCGTESASTGRRLPNKDVETLSKESAQLFIFKNAPIWVVNGTNYVKASDERQFVGVSSASVMGDMALQKATADDNARAETARIISVFMNNLSHHYLAENKRLIDEAQLLTKLESASQLIKRNTRIVSSWREKRSNTIWVSAVLDMKLVKNQMAGIAEFDEDFRLYFEATADAIFDQLSTVNSLPVQ